MINVKIRTRIIFFVLLFVCLQACQQSRYEMHEKMVQYESEYWFDHSISHVLLNRMVSAETQVVWSTTFHTAAPVPLGAVGPQRFVTKLQGVLQNDSLGRVLKEAVDEKLNVILVIGDGMGNMHMALPIYKRYAERNSQPTTFERIMSEGSCGYLYTGTADGLVTGSAASGTAIACGQKTLMNMVGVDSTGVPMESALSLAGRNGYKTALVSDAAITDATPAAFYAHSIDRDDENKIAGQLAASAEVDIILGGGLSHFIPAQTQFSDFKAIPDSQNFNSARRDSLNLISRFQNQSYQFCYNNTGLAQISSAKKLLGLFAGGGLPAPIDRDSGTLDIPTVLQMGHKALELTSGSGAPYFIMIECARIDWESHDNDLGAVFRAVEEMDRVLQLAYEYYQKSPGNTLLVFTADHETGGLEFAYRKMPEEQAMRRKMKNGEEWVNVTNPLTYENYLSVLSRQKKTVSSVLSKSHSTSELMNNVKEELGITLSEEEAALLFYSMTGYKKYKD